LFQIEDSDIEKILNNAADRIKDQEHKIMVTHVPPHNTKLDDLGWTNAGSKGVRKAIEKIQPDLCLCGHIHETFGKSEKIGKTKVINVGRKGKIIEI
jgi:Icc-related predicted phosphoesterase